MRVAALDDVHGFVHALEAVLREVEGEGVDLVLFGGDVAHGPFPRETLALVRALPNARFVRGNADLLAEPTGSDLGDRARRFSERQIGEDQVEWLASLPFSERIDDTLYVHANPRNVYDVITELTPEAEVASYLEGVSEQRVVTGHIHLQFSRVVRGVEWVGAGSVGWPYEDEHAAYWALLTPDEVELRRTDYDLDFAAAGVAASGHPRAHEWADRPTRARALEFLS